MKTIWLAFSVIFIAELGDKTQLAVLALKSKGLTGWYIFFGAMMAFAILTGMALFFGEWINNNIPTKMIERIAAISFIVIGILMWFNKI